MTVLPDISNNALQELIPYRKGKKWGLCDKDKKIVTECKYDWVTRITKSGFYKAHMNNSKYGVINNYGIEIAPCIYDQSVDCWSEDIAYFKRDCKYGFLNKIGEEIVPPKYENADCFSENRAAVKCNGKWGFINNAGKEIIPCIYERVYFFKDGFAPVSLDNKQGYINKEGEILIPLIYDSAFAFSDEKIKVKLNELEGIINIKGEIIIPLVYDSIGFSDDLLIASFDGRFGLIDWNNIIRVPFEYQYISEFTDDLAKVKLYGKYGMINRNGHEIIPCIYDKLSDFAFGLAIVSINQRQGLIDKTNKLIIPFNRDYYINEILSPDVIELQINGTPTHLFIKSNLKVQNFFIYPFSDGLYCAKLAGKYGYIDGNGNVVIEFKYDSAGQFLNGIAQVKLNNVISWIDRNENVIRQFDYPYIGSFEDGYARTKRGFINEKGEEIALVRKYDYVKDKFSDGLALVASHEKFGFIDKSGKEIIGLKFSREEIEDNELSNYEFENGLVFIYSDHAYGYIDKKGTEYWED